jgi:hypothetical protein
MLCPRLHHWIGIDELGKFFEAFAIAEVIAADALGIHEIVKSIAAGQFLPTNGGQKFRLPRASPQIFN